MLFSRIDQCSKRVVAIEHQDGRVIKGQHLVQEMGEMDIPVLDPTVIVGCDRA